MNNQVLQNVVKSVWVPKKSLLLTIILFIICIYVFATFGYLYFNEGLDFEKSGGEPCKNIFECFVIIMDKSFKFDGGIGGYLAYANEYTEESIEEGEYIPLDLKRFAFDNLFLIILMVLMINIIAGIIIDTFGSLRDDAKEFKDDIEDFCFICGFDKETLDKVSERKNGFLHHIRNDHYQWNYLFYIAYLLEKEPTEYTGLESYVMEKIEKQDISWFPCHRAILMKDNSNVVAQEMLTRAILQIEEKVRFRLCSN